MKEKKQSANWNVAATHYLTAGFVVPFVSSLVIGVPMIAVFGADSLAANIGHIVVTPLIVWFSVMYSARYISKTYVINDSQKVINLSTVYLIVIAGGFSLYALLGSFDIISILDIVRVVVMVGMFYIASKKFLHNTDQVGAAPDTDVKS